jgi:large subunit ribosomal protein L10
MPTEAKKATVAELKEDLSSAKATIVADYRGLTVSEISAVRRVLRGEGIKYRVVKNRLAKIAAQEAGHDELVGLLEGPTALAISGGDEVALARTFLDAVRPYKTVTVRGAVLSGRRVDAASVTRLSTLPSREVLLGQLAGGIVAPLATMASLFAAPLRNLGYALTQLVAKKEAAEPKAEAPKAEAVRAEAVAAEPEAAAEAPEAEAAAEAPEAEAAAEAPEAEAAAEAPEAEAAAEAPDETSADSEPAAESDNSETNDQKENN